MSLSASFKTKSAALLCLACLFTGCAFPLADTKTPRGALVKVPEWMLPEFSDDMDPDGIRRALENSLAWLERLDPGKKHSLGPDTWTSADLVESIRAFLALLGQTRDPAKFSRAVREQFDVYRATGTNGWGRMFITGYYEPVIEGCRQYSDACRHPLYRRPDTLVTADLGDFDPKYKGVRLFGRVENGRFLPFYTREEIDSKASLAGKGLEIAWLKDPVDAFFLHVQGSGRVILEDGEEIHAHYAGTNGHPYRSAGKVLIREGRVPKEEMSMQRIRRYVEENPGERERVFNHNPSYVFFETVKEGPLGAAGVVLTPGRSVAVDRTLFPMGALVYLESKKPVLNNRGEILLWKDFGRFATVQDTGGAIQGPGRMDLFCGSGTFAETMAGHLRHPGALYFLMLKKERLRR
jgi:membrane-bound lytic murein transglycosylase A